MIKRTKNLYSILYLPILAIVGMHTTDANAAMVSRVSVENKSSQFDDVLGDTSSSKSTGASAMADRIRQQRAALDTESTASNALEKSRATLASGQNACDAGLRKCMMEKCGDESFSKCANEGDTDLGIKLDACRAKVTCTGEEFRLFSTEIKADIDVNAQMSLYLRTIECGNMYNTCMAEQCGGDKYTKCLNNAAMTAAGEKCKTIANDCRQMDTGLNARFGEFIAYLRQDAEITIAADEERLYALRDKMAEQCKFLGAMFDERTFDCVYTIGFYSGEDTTTPTASKKLYAGGTFNCDQNWFGIDITTFKENAYRFTRSETSASSAVLGAGVGVGVGAVTSGAIGRAIDTKKAKNAMEDAQREANGGLTDKELKKQKDKDEKEAKKKTDCEAKTGYEWVDGKCKKKEGNSDKKSTGGGN